MFFSILKKRIFRKYMIASITVLLLMIFLSFYIRGYEDILYFHNLESGEYTFLISDEDPILSNATINRSNTNRLEMEKSYIYNFESVFNHSIYLYDIFSPLFLSLPVISFYLERKKGLFSNILLRSNNYKKTILCEGFSCSIAGWLIALLPCIVSWLIMCIFCPFLHDLSRAVISNPYSVLGFLYTEKSLHYAYLLHVLIYSITFFFLTFLTFSVSFFIKKSVVIIFFPLLFTQVMTSILKIFSLEYYSPVFALGEINVCVSYGPIIVSCFHMFLISMFLILSVRKGNIIFG